MHTLPDCFQCRFFWDFEFLEVGTVAIVFGLLALVIDTEVSEDAQSIETSKNLPSL